MDASQVAVVQCSNDYFVNNSFVVWVQPHI